MATDLILQMFAWYFFVIGVAIYLSPRRFVVAMEEMITQPGQSMFTAIVTLVLGIVLVVFHNVWVVGWPLFVTILCWLTLIKGIVRLWIPDQVHALARVMLQRKGLEYIGGIYALAGAYLLYVTYYLGL